jgi:hypothetical protein
MPSDAAGCVHLLEADGYHEQAAMLCPRGCRQMLRMDLPIASFAPKIGKPAERVQADQTRGADPIVHAARGRTSNGPFG